MNAGTTDTSEWQRTFPKSVQPGIPKLRTLKPSWKRVKIGSLFEIVNRPCQLNDADSYRLVTVKRSRGGIEPRGALVGAEIAVKSQFYIKAGDFLISKRQIVHGACAVVEEEFEGAIVSNEYAVLRCKPALDLGFLRQLIHSVYFQQTCFHSSIGVHVEKMIFSIPQWFEWPIDIPEIDEQRRLAAFLGAIDGRIGLLRRRRVGLQRYKKGVMRSMFDQTLRFKREDGTTFPDWEEKQFSDFVFRVPDKFDPVAASSAPVTIELENIEAETGRIFGFSRLEDQQSLKGVFQAGDILFGKLRPYLRKYWLADREGICSSEIWVLRTEGVVTGFVYYLIQTERFMRSANQSSGSKMPRADWSVVGQSIYCIPHPDEQRKIADFLSALDDRIAAVAAKIDAMQTFKKGLLQQIFD